MQLLEKLLVAQERQLGHSAEPLAITLVTMGRLVLGQSGAVAALPHFKRAWKILMQAKADALRPDVLDCEQRLGQMLWDTKQWREGQRLFTQAHRRRQVLAQAHVTKLVTELVAGGMELDDAVEQVMAQEQGDADDDVDGDGVENGPPRRASMAVAQATMSAAATAARESAVVALAAEQAARAKAEAEAAAKAKADAAREALEAQRRAQAAVDADPDEVAAREAAKAARKAARRLDYRSERKAYRQALRLEKKRRKERKAARDAKEVARQEGLRKTAEAAAKKKAEIKAELENFKNMAFARGGPDGHAAALAAEKAAKEAEAKAKEPKPPTPSQLAAAALEKSRAFERQANAAELLANDDRTHERAARREARAAAKAAVEQEKEDRTKGLHAREVEDVLAQYPDSDTDSDCYEVVDGQRAKVTHRYAVKVLPVASTLDSCLAFPRWCKMLRQFAKREGTGGKYMIDFMMMVNQFRRAPKPKQRVEIMADRIPLPEEDRGVLAAQIYARYLKTQHELPNVPQVIRDEVASDVRVGVEDNTFDAAYHTVFDLCCTGLFQRFFKHPLGQRFIAEKALGAGLMPHWEVEEVGKLAGRKRTYYTVKAQSVVRRQVACGLLPQCCGVPSVGVLC